MNAKAATMSVTRMQTAPILLGFIIAPVKKDLLGMDIHAQVENYRDAMVQYYIISSVMHVSDWFSLMIYWRTDV